MSESCLVQKVDLLGVAWPVWVCKNTGVEYGTPECANVMIFGECNPREPEYYHRRMKLKYRKTHPDQVTMNGNNLREIFWGNSQKKIEVELK